MSDANRPYRLAEAYDPMTCGLLPHAEVAVYYAGLLRRFAPGASTLLEVACGTGNLTLPLARLGFEVIGLDISPEMLAVAKDKAAAAGLEIRFLHRDLRDAYPGEPVDAALCFYGGLNFLTSPRQLRRGFESIAGALGPGGLWIFDQFPPERMRALFSGRRQGKWRGFTAATRSRCRRDGRIEHRVTFELLGADGSRRREVEIHRLRIHPFDQIVALLQETGFELLEAEEIDRRVAGAALEDDHVFVARRR